MCVRSSALLCAIPVQSSSYRIVCKLHREAARLRASTRTLSSALRSSVYIERKRANFSAAIALRERLCEHRTSERTNNCQAQFSCESCNLSRRERSQPVRISRCLIRRKSSSPKAEPARFCDRSRSFAASTQPFQLGSESQHT